MKKSEWKDRDIEELVRKLPQISDDRTPQSIYANIERQNKKRLISFNRVIPTVAALAVMFILVMLAPSVLNQFNEESMEKSEMNSLESSDKTTGNTAQESEHHPKLGNSEMKESSVQEETSQFSMAVEEREGNPVAADKLSLYKEDLEGNDFYSYGLISPEAIPVPISVVDEQGEEADGWLVRQEELAGKLPEGSWGMEEYHPLKGNFEMGDNRILFTLDEGHPYSGSSAVEYAFYHSLLYSFQYKDVNEIVLQEHDGSVPQFSSTGEFPRIELNENVHTAYYLYSPNGKERFLVPDNINRGNIKKSIQAMKNPDRNVFQSVIPKNINISVSDSDDDLTINFLNELDIEALHHDRALEMIEGLLLTSKSSGYEKVKFENIKQQKWNGFDFQEPIETPIGPNKKRLDR
ncbi:GerMN domain-containing protein [Rossellomorea sp. AcN35-11]|nr:hypothetical protein [Rossellomorea aquimaris]NMH68778.1 hypothetical protein [Bacillus sp. RO3]WJV28173.1 GerMN domain-containing protein [Rossellomorea sp. AcN35-11]